MRVALDVRYRKPSGAATYIRQLVPRLLREPGAFDFVLVRYAGDRSWDRWAGVEVIGCPRRTAPEQVAWDQAILPLRLRKSGVDLYHTLKLLGPRIAPCPQLKVAHSITLPYRGEFPTSPAHQLYWNTLGRSLFRSADGLIAVSGFVRSFLVDRLGVPADRIHVIPHGVDGQFRPGPSDADSPVPVRGEYLLAVGNVTPVKNHLAVVEAFSTVADRWPGHDLVIAGGLSHPYAREVVQWVAELGLDGRVHFPGFVEPERLPALYRGAALFLMPSLSEGFALTMLEAMASGVPVIASGRGALPEVGGDAARLVEDPRDVETWSAAIDALLGDGEERRRLAAAGLARAAEFDWDRAAEQTLAVYRSFAP